MTTEGKNTFQVVDEGFTLREAVAEAKKCLQCKVPLCRKGCPIENDIPQFIHALTMGNLGDAMRIINEKSNLLPSVDVFVHTKSNVKGIVCSTKRMNLSK